MTSLPHIVITCSRLDLPSGYEKAITQTASLFAEVGHPVTLLILDDTPYIYFPLEPRIKIIQRNWNFGITEKGNFISRKWQWYKQNKLFGNTVKTLKAGILICTEYQHTVAAAQTKLYRTIPVYNWEHHHYASVTRNSFWRFFSKNAYRNITSVICLNKNEQKYYPRFTRITVIPNFTEPVANISYEARKQLILTVARLTPIKGINHLLGVSKMVLEKSPGWVWKLIGEGEMKDVVTSYIRENNLQGRLILQEPRSYDLQEEYRYAALYVMTSKTEAFPLVLLEALSWGVPAVSFDCPTGPSQIITHQVTGMLAPEGDEAALAEIILDLIRNEKKRNQYSISSINKATQFSPKAVYRFWNALFENGLSGFNH